MIIDQINGEKRRGLSKRLIELGLLKSTISDSGGYFKDVPRKILTLTPKGLEILSHAVPLSYGYDFNKGVNQAELRHHHIAQKVTLNFFLGKDDNLKYFSTELDRLGKSIIGMKEPDVVLFFDESMPNELDVGVERLRKIAAEVELTGKYGLKFDRFKESILTAIEPDGTYGEVFIYFDSMHQLDRYKRALSPGNEVNVWEKNSRGYWEVEEVIVVPDYAKHAIQFILLG
ncbi:hypothetical protein [Acinetobacter sp.]|uniref:hypothetical protein n=1 Tax=Acinetobacter sp. TaxID=472 RepID=UPI003752E39A